MTRCYVWELLFLLPALALVATAAESKDPHPQHSVTAASTHQTHPGQCSSTGTCPDDNVSILEPSDFTQTDFWVAGVNLGAYGLPSHSEEVDATTTPPFELFEDFDIGSLLQGDEGWWEILEIRKNLPRKSWSFYVDKVARKRWIGAATQGKRIDQAEQFALRYGSELEGAGDRQDTAEAIYRLLPNTTNFCAKPNHFSETGGIWLVSRHPVTNETMISSKARSLNAEEGDEFDNWDVAYDLADNLDETAPAKESWALQNVQPGFVVEERFSHVQHWERPPWEFCIFVIWGRVWVGQFNYVEEQERFTGAYFYRNGTAVKGSFDEIPELVDWDYLVETAEKLGANKDMFRVDFLVGRPSGGPSLTGASDEQVKASMRHILSESEVFPTTLFFSNSLPEDGARLWMAGYKQGNYKVVPNTEVPNEFLEWGRLPDPMLEVPESVTESNATTEVGQMIEDLIRWIRDNGGYVNKHLRIDRIRPDDPTSPIHVWATELIKPEEILVNIPWKLMVTPDDPENDDLCETILATVRELDRYHSGTSDKAPYLRLLEHLSKPVMLPDGWSDPGINLLSSVVGENLPPQNTGSHRRWITQSCGIDKNDEEAIRIALFVISNRSGGFHTPGHHQQEVMMPFLDLFSHRDEPFYNTQLTQAHSGKDIGVAASQYIKIGATVYGSNGYGESMGTPHVLHDSGIVEDYPRRFDFQLYGEGGTIYDIDFILEVPHDDLDELVVKWPHGRPSTTKAFDAMQHELDRLGTMQGLFDDSVVPPDELPLHEYRLVKEYYFALQDGMQRAIMAGTGPWERSRYTQTDFVVAGVNLGEYKLSEDLVVAQEQPPYELFEDFDIGDLLQGHEDWQDILKLRRNLQRPSWSFYIDKCARKRWMPSQGIDQAKQLVLRYGSELKGAGDVQEEAKAIFELLPNNTNYCAKPNHFSETGGIWLVSQHPQTNETMISSRARSLNAAEGKKFSNADVAQGLAENLHELAQEKESWALKNVQPGFSVEERFSHVSHWERPPWEFCVFVIWGKVWVAQYNYVESQRRFTGAFFYRNGTAVKGSFDKEVPSFVDWDYLMKTAEKLGANKDMFRVDFLVGRPSSGPSLSAASDEEVTASVRHILGESEVFPTTLFFSDALPQDGARLWMAGYKAGNYKVVPNTEVPKVFLELGRLPAGYDAATELK